MRKCFAVTFVVAIFASGAFAADDVSSAVVATVKTVDRGAKTAVVKTKDGTESTIRFTGRTVSHGAEATAKGTRDAFEGVKEGDDVIVHYTEKAGVKTADEVDHVGKAGLKMSEAAVKSVDRGAKTVTVKTADGVEATYQASDRTVKEAGKGLENGGKVTVYYTEDAGKKVAHFFKTN
jgi:hypothetical protein